MNQTAWAVLLPRTSVLAAGALRLRGDVRVREADDALWLRGDNLTDELDLELRRLPGALRHTVDTDDRYTETDHRIPAGTLPADGWVPLSSWLKPQPQPAALAGTLPRRAPLRVERSETEQPASLLLTTLAAWHTYATTAPAVRLCPLRFAACANGRTIIHGTPLPPVQGRRYAERDGVAVPCGFAIVPRLEPAVLRDVLALKPGDVVLFAEDGSYEQINAGSFARATRAAARASFDGSKP